MNLVWWYLCFLFSMGAATIAPFTEDCSSSFTAAKWSGWSHLYIGGYEDRCGNSPSGGACYFQGASGDRYISSQAVDVSPYDVMRVRFSLRVGDSSWRFVWTCSGPDWTSNYPQFEVQKDSAGWSVIDSYPRMGGWSSYDYSVTVGTATQMNFRWYQHGGLDLTIDYALWGVDTISVQGVNWPVVTSVTRPPTTGGLVTITGNYYFSGCTATLDGATCSSPTFLSTTSMTCEAPGGTGAGHDMKITCDIYTSLANTVFSYADPVISSIPSIPTTGGTAQVQGSNFGGGPPSPYLIAATVNGFSTTVSWVSQTEMSITIPPGSGFASIQVTVDGLTSNVYTFAYSVPVISTVSSPQTTGGAITITGQNFGPSGTLVHILVDGNECTDPSVVAHTQITCTVAAGVGTGKSVVLDVPASGGQQSSASLFSYQPPSIISFSSPSTGSASALIQGTNFGPGGSYQVFILFDGTQQNCLWGSQTTIWCPIPTATNMGTHTVIPVVDGNTGSSFDFTYDAPQVTTVSSIPTSGGQITITGLNFGPSGTVASVTIEGQECTDPVVVSHTSITCYFGTGTGADLPVIVTVGSKSGSGLFSYQAPRISSIESPPTAGDFPVTITGENFGPGGAYQISVIYDSDTTVLSATWLSDTTLSVTFPPGTGYHYISVIINGIESVTPFTMCYHAPVINSASAVEAAGGTVTILGTNFGPLLSSVVVTFNGVTCSDARVVQAHVQISCNAGAGVGTGIPISMAVDGGLQGTGFGAYKPPVVSGASCPSEGGSSGLIMGGEFGPGGSYDVSVTIDGSSCTSPVVLSQTLLSCNFPAAAIQDDLAHNHTISVTIAGQVSNSAMWSYSSPSIYSCSKPSTSGGAIIITGSSFGPTGTISCVTVGGVTCANPYTVAHTTISCQVSPGQGVNQVIEVQTPCPGGKYASASIFSYQGPSVSSVSNPSTAGGAIEITGENFGALFTEVQVKVGSVQCPITSFTAHSSITCTAPSGTGLPTLSVVVAGNTPAITPMSYLAPSISSSSQVGTPGGTSIIAGSNFGPGTPTPIVSINGLPCQSVLMLSAHNKLSCTAPAGYGTSSPMVMSVDGLVSDGVSFPYAGPTISAVTSTPTSGGFTIISGTNFAASIDAVSVQIGGKPCSKLRYVQEHTQLNCSVSEGVGKTLPVSLSVGGQVCSFATGFSYEAPVLFSASSAGTSGGLVTLYGTDFGPQGTAATVKVSGVEYSGALVSVAHSQIAFTIGPGTGASKVTQVIVANQSSAATMIFSYLNPVVHYASCTDFGGGVTHIEGDNFGNDVSKISVNIGGIQCTGVTLVTEHVAIECSIVAGSGANLTVDVTVDGLSGSAPVFSYVDSIPPNCTISGDSKEEPLSDEFEVDITCSETVFGLILSDIISVGCGPEWISGHGARYVVNMLRNNSSPNCTIKLPPGAVYDAGNNPNPASNLYRVRFSKNGSTSKGTMIGVIAACILGAGAVTGAAVCAGIYFRKKKKEPVPELNIPMEVAQDSSFVPVEESSMYASTAEPVETDDYAQSITVSVGSTSAEVPPYGCPTTNDGA
ncbi:zymogen granule membrane glycoprotein [Pelomyxa schiedti]|nr:zymogen granule membrane glycoprotein [Pelomyxa schiedti]